MSDFEKQIKVTDDGQVFIDGKKEPWYGACEINSETETDSGIVVRIDIIRD